MNVNPTGGAQLQSLTVRNFARIQLPYAITVNAVSQYFPVVTTAGTLRMCLYDSAGTTKLIDEVITPVASTTVTATLASAVPLTPGEYWLVMGCATTCNVQVLAAVSQTGGFNVTGSPAGKQPWFGTVTHTSGTCNTAVGTPVNAAVNTIVMRFDN